MTNINQNHIPAGTAGVSDFDASEALGLITAILIEVGPSGDQSGGQVVLLTGAELDSLMHLEFPITLSLSKEERDVRSFVEVHGSYSASGAELISSVEAHTISAAALRGYCLLLSQWIQSGAIDPKELRRALGTLEVKRIVAFAGGAEAKKHLGRVSVAAGGFAPEAAFLSMQHHVRNAGVPSFCVDIDVSSNTFKPINSKLNALVKLTFSRFTDATKVSALIGVGSHGNAARND